MWLFPTMLQIMSFAFITNSKFRSRSRSWSRPGFWRLNIGFKITYLIKASLATARHQPHLPDELGELFDFNVSPGRRWHFELCMWHFWFHPFKPEASESIKRFWFGKNLGHGSLLWTQMIGIHFYKEGVSLCRMGNDVRYSDYLFRKPKGLLSHDICQHKHPDKEVI